MAFSVATVFWHLLHHPSARARLTNEVRAAFSCVSDIRGGPILDSCTYLQACVKETMRLCPPIPNHLPRHVQSGGITVDGQHLPEGTQIGVVHYSLFRNPDYFRDPTAWRPERWIADPAHGTTAESVQQAEKAFFPFSFGPRVCVGQAIADMELRTVLARALWSYDMRMAPDAPCCARTPAGQPCDPCMGSFVAATLPEGGPMAQFRKRNDLLIRS
jgi:cytochrome P450